jgi:glyoxylase-like metal-dependent hydrolase (beta-lactamase superfamily II)
MPTDMSWWTRAWISRSTTFSERGLVEFGPGVVLIKAPGHTPGSQMIYVVLASGRDTF